VTDFCPVTPLDVAIIVAGPASRPVINPEASTCAIVGSELDQVTFTAGEVLPEASVIVAEAWTDVPDAIGSVPIVIESEADWPPLGAVETDPPQALTVSAIVATTVGRFFFMRYLSSVASVAARVPTL